MFEVEKKHPKHNSTSFKKGMIPHNKKPRISVNCKYCNKEFKVFPHRVLKAKCCSVECSRKFIKIDPERRSKRQLCYKYATGGKTNREIAELMGIPSGTVGGYLNQIKFRRYADGGKSYSSIKNKLLKRDDYKNCCICGFDRIVEVAHIIPASKGGVLSYKNTSPLCPNHHHLFDNNRSLGYEIIKINLEMDKRNASKE